MFKTFIDFFKRYTVTEKQAINVIQKHYKEHLNSNELKKNELINHINRTLHNSVDVIVFDDIGNPVSFKTIIDSEEDVSLFDDHIFHVSERKRIKDRSAKTTLLNDIRTKL